MKPSAASNRPPAAAFVLLTALAACSPTRVDERTFDEIPCTIVTDGFGPDGEVKVRVEIVADGLAIPWALAFLPGGSDVLLTERPGRIRLIRGGQLVAQPVATVALTDVGAEGGLLGLTLDPDFETNRRFFVYTSDVTNEVSAWTLAADGLSAQRDRVILTGIPSADFHSGGRLLTGPDGMLYIATGDAKQPELSQDLGSLAGKLLRITPEGEIPADNPFPGSPVWISGIRNCQGFDFAPDGRLYVTDHGPTGELLRTGEDEVNVAGAGANLGWPDVRRCGTAPDIITPSLTWDAAVPPGGAAIYTGSLFPEWAGSLFLTTLGARHLHRVEFSAEAPERVTRHDVYLRNAYGRLREVRTGPDGALWVTTTNCDSYGQCPAHGDQVLRVVR